MKRIVIINGPNLDRLGLREPEIYGDQTLTDLENLLVEEASVLGVEVQFYQSNHEGFIIDEINNEYADGEVFGLIINPGALTHTSLALRDALAGCDLPVIEVAFLNGQESPVIETAEADFNVLGVRMRGYHDFGVALQDPRGGVRCKGEA